MLDSKKDILDFAKIWKNNPEKFFTILNDSLKIRYPEKADKISEVGLMLFSNSYLVLAMTLWKYSLDYYIKSNDLEGMGFSYLNLGAGYNDLRQYKEAIEYGKKALKIYNSTGDQGCIAKCYINLGVVHSRIKQHEKAIDYQNDALLIKIKIKDVQGQANCYLNLGNNYRNLGQYQKAIECEEKALKIYNITGDQSGIADCNSNLGIIHNKLGQYQKAIEFQEKALKIYNITGDQSGIAGCNSNIGNSYDRLNQPQKTIEFQEKALKIYNTTGDQSGIAGCYVGLGAANLALNTQYKEAIEYGKKALKIYNTIGDVGGQANCFGNISTGYRKLGQYKEAIEFQEKALKIYNTIGDVADEANSYEHIAASYDLLGKINKSLDAIKQSITLSESLGPEITNQEQKSTYYDQFSKRYRFAVKKLLEIGNTNEAFEYVEKSKARSILDLFTAKNDKGEQNRMFGKHLSLEKIRQIISQNTLILEYFFLDNNILIFVIRKDGMKIVSVPIDTNKFNNLCDMYQKEIISYLDHQNNTQSWSELNVYLIKPIEKYILQNDSIIFVPNETLFDIPLHLLSIGDVLLIKSNPVSYSVSASFLQFHRSNKKISTYSGAIFSAASPDDDDDVKKAITSEATEIECLFSTHSKLKITKQDALSEIIQNNCDVMHFSCHGEFNHDDPMSSGILFHSPDGKMEPQRDILTARDMLKFSIKSDLVTLSACNTGLNKTGSGDNLLGLTYSFLLAGASSILVSLWEPEAEVTKYLMIEFYKNLKKSKNKAKALQQAQITIMNMSEYSHPYFWAPFILIGNPN